MVFGLLVLIANSMFLRGPHALEAFAADAPSAQT
jgi:hypothetical protein